MLGGRWQWQKRGKASLLHSIQLLLATPAGERYEQWSWSCWSIISSPQRWVLKTCCHSAFHPGSAVSERARWEGLRVFGERPVLPETQLQSSGSRHRRWEPRTIKGNLFNTALNKLFCVGKLVEIMCLGCNSTIFHNSSLCLPVTYFYFFNILASVEWRSKSEMFGFAQSFSSCKFSKVCTSFLAAVTEVVVTCKIFEELFSFKGMNICHFVKEPSEFMKT